ncbi:MAG TPA: VWA domain-containing protein [Anaerolineales bacterium]|nr:VWA domain-containing protein [Anaerolineales bacterium]
MTSPSLLDQTEFADNPEPRCPVVLLLDTSGSMNGAPIEQLNGALQTFSRELKADPLASLRVEVAVITFGGEVRAVDVTGEGQLDALDASRAFITVDRFVPPTLQARGGTLMGEATRRALDLLRQRKEIYKQNSADYFRPWVFLITDGKPTDVWQSAAEQARLEESRKGLLFFGIGVEGADLKALSQFCPPNRPPLKLKGLAFSELFQWLSKSLSAVAHSKLGEQVPLPPVGWAEIETSK